MSHSIFIDRRQAGRTLMQILQASLQMSRRDALLALGNRQVTISGGVCTDGERRVRAGHHVQVGARATEAPKMPAVAQRIVLRYIDDQIVVVEKPAGLTTVRHADEAESFGSRAKKFLPSTLVDLLPAVLHAEGHTLRGRIRAVHRIDKETSGLVILARTADAESKLGKQFRAHSVGRHYLALVRGNPGDVTIESSFVADRGDGRRGSADAADGQHAVTHVRVVEPRGEFTLVECRLETGRTHQVRIHLGEHGTPLCGERVYDRPLHGQPLPDASNARRPLLHAAYLAVDHPRMEKRMEWTAELPEDMKP